MVDQFKKIAVVNYKPFELLPEVLEPRVRIWDDQVFHPIVAVPQPPAGAGEVPVPVEEVPPVPEGPQKRVVSLPPRLTGTVVHGPDARPAANVAVVVRPQDQAFERWPRTVTVTDSRGTFSLLLPATVLTLPPVDDPAADPDAADPPLIEIEVRGGDQQPHEFLLTVSEIGGGGQVANPLVVDDLLPPMPGDILSQLNSVANWQPPRDGQAVLSAAPLNPPPEISLGEGEGAISFRADLSQRRYPYNVLMRLVEPLVQGAVVGDETTQDIVPRQPVAAPISVDAFRDGLHGVANGVVGALRTTPVAATLGIGYVLHLAQQWMPNGLSLGNLVYSLPLAPGEQQRVVVYEQRESFTVTESESLDTSESRQQRMLADSSSSAVFETALHEVIQGSSAFETSASSSSWGAAGGFGLALGPLMIGGGGGGGGGRSSASGQSSSTLDSSRIYASQAAQSAHSAVEQQSYARRRAQRTAMRMATAADTESAVSKVLTNNNRVHALTIQYWEVLRHFRVSTVVEGVSLVCMVPLEPIRFLAPDEPVRLNQVKVESLQAGNRDAILARYGMLLRHADVLRRALPRGFQRGIALLEQFAANPAAVPNLSDVAQEILRVDISGSLLPCEDVSVSAVTRWGSRVGPIRFSSLTPNPLPGTVVPADALASRAELLRELHDRRDNRFEVRRAHIALPHTVALPDVSGFELSRTFRPLRYQLNTTLPPGLQFMFTTAGVNPAVYAESVNGVNMSPAQLEQELGGPRIAEFSVARLPGSSIGADVVGDQITSAFEFAFAGATHPVSAALRPPELRLKDLLEIEKTLQHVVGNSITYSKSVWLSLSAEERVMLLEAYTIAAPEGQDASDVAPNGQTPQPIAEVPLLNCVSPQPLGFYGNALVLPFTLPPSAAGQVGTMGTKSLQDALTDYHRANFSSPESSIALPTRGVLAEAVLGRNPSAEKVDLTRFWNWSDSPIDRADAVPSGLVGSGEAIFSARPGDSLTGVPAMITNVNGAAGGADSELVKALIAGRDDTKFQDITGQQNLATLVKETLSTAESARADALNKAQSSMNKAMDLVPTVLKAQQAAKAEEAAKKKLAGGPPAPGGGAAPPPPGGTGATGPTPP